MTTTTREPRPTSTAEGGEAITIAAHSTAKECTRQATTMQAIMQDQYVGLIPVIPGGLWEVFIGVWLIAKGFRASPISSEQITSSTTPRRTAPEVGSATI